MRDDARVRARRAPRSVLTPAELTGRRVAWRRRRTRRRRAVAVGALVAGALIVAITGSSGDPAGARRPAGSQTAESRAGSHVASHSRGRVSRAAVDLVLGYTSYVQLAGHRRPDVALTFDDGPSRYTGAILTVLRRMHALATFFVVGKLAKSYPQLVAAEARAGNEVGDHTETHPPLAELAPVAQLAQISAAAQAIRRGGAPFPVLMRPPYGSFNPATMQILRAKRMLMILWSVDPKDYARPGVVRIVSTALSGARGGSIVLMHDGGGDRSETIAALPRIITGLHRRGFRLVTIPRLLADDPPPHGQPPPRSLSGGV